MDSDPLDFENEDPLISSPPSSTKRRKVIGLDDLINDHYVEQNSPVKKKSKKTKALEQNDSDDEDDKARISKVVDDFENQVNRMFTEDDKPLWGQKIFGRQKSSPPVDLKEPVNCELLQSFKRIEISSLFGTSDEGEGFMEGLMMNGWLSQLAMTSGSVEDSIASWTFYTLLYSSNEELQFSACDFWCKVLLSKDEANQPLVKFGWFPTYSQLIAALEVYGYLYDSTGSCSSVSKSISPDSECEGPPANIWSWINIISACCRFRCVKPFFSTSEAVELLIVIINIFLDRQLQGLSVVLNACMESIISFFSDDEWDASCKSVACTVASRIPKDLNCVRIAECISAASNRSKCLRSQVALQTLMLCLNKKVSDGEGILKVLMSTNVKDKDCDFFKLYIYLVLVENWLLSYHSLQEKDAILNLWCKCLRNCSTQITSTDWRSHASKVRNKASYLLLNIVK